jgi:hypothetical protein
MSTVSNELRLRPAGWTYALFGVGGLAVLGMLWPGAIIEGEAWLQAAAVAATAGWALWVVAMVRGELRVSGGVLQCRLLFSRQVDLRDLQWVALSPEAPDLASPQAAAYSMYAVALGDSSGGTVSFSANPSLWPRPGALLRTVAEAVESSGALISEANWAMLRSKAELEPAPLPPASRESEWVEHFTFNQKNLAGMSMAVALIGLWPLSWVVLRVFGGRAGPLEAVVSILALAFLAYTAYDHRVGRRLGYRMRPDGRVTVLRRHGRTRLGIVEETVDLTRAVDVAIEPELIVRGEVRTYQLRVHDRAAGEAILPLAEGLLPPMRFWVQATELLERSGVAIPQDAARQIERVIGRPPDNPRM